MNLVQRALEDIKRFTTDLSGFGVPLVFSTADNSQIVTVEGIASSHYLSVSNEGAPVIGKNVSCAVHEAALNESGLNVRNAAGEIILQKMKVSWTDSTGISKTYKIFSVQPDNTVGLIVFFCKEYE